MNTSNEIGIARQLDLPRIRKLLSIGLFAAVLHFAGDMILGWGVEDETQTGILRMLSAYTGTSDGGILAAALLGLLGMALEGLACFGVYRMMVPYSPKYAHSYCAGIFGYLRTDAVPPVGLGVLDARRYAACHAAERVRQCPRCQCALLRGGRVREPLDVRRAAHSAATCLIL